MGGSVGLQIFLLLDMFFIGVLTTLAVQHFVLHRRDKKKSAELTPVKSLPPVHMSHELKERLVKESQSRFREAVQESTTELQNELEATSSQINVAMQRIGGEIVGNELERYRVNLNQIREQAEKTIQVAQTELVKHQEELHAELSKEIEAQKAFLIQQLDTKVSDAVVSFLVEALQHNVDLGAQTPYLTALLEEHKAEFKQEVDDGPTAEAAQ